MAKKASAGRDGAKSKNSKSSGKGKSSASRPRAVAVKSTSSRGGDAGDAFIKLLQSPLVADLLAVAATAALAALAEHGFSSGGASTTGRNRAGKAVKEAGKAAAAAIGRRLSTEVDEIRAASKRARADAEA